MSSLSFSSDVMFALPEIFMAVMALVLLMSAVFKKSESRVSFVSWATVATLAATFVLVLFTSPAKIVTFNGVFISDYFSKVLKLLILGSSAVILLLSTNLLDKNNLKKGEYPVLILLSTLGMMLMVSANDLMSLFVGLELQSLSLYVITAFNRKDAKSTEAALKYFVLGALSTGLLLYGSSLIYGFSGTTNFEGIQAALADGNAKLSLGLFIGLVFLVTALGFKVSAAPFHMWTPDVYEGSPTLVTAFLASAPKLAAFGLLIRVVYHPLMHMTDQIQMLLVFLSVLSMIVGAVAALMQTNVKRLLAYSSIGHMGYALMGLASGDLIGIRNVLTYLMIYLVMTIGVFTCLMVVRKRGQFIEDIRDFSGLAKNNPSVAAIMAILMFSMAGIPPLAGFFAKFYVFMAALQSQLYTTAIIGVLASVVAAFYYLRIIKIMYFDKSGQEGDVQWGASVVLSRESALVLLLSGIILVGFIVYPSFILDHANFAALSLHS